MAPQGLSPFLGSTLLSIARRARPTLSWEGAYVVFLVPDSAVVQVCRHVGTWVFFYRSASTSPWGTQLGHMWVGRKLGARESWRLDAKSPRT